MTGKALAEALDRCEALLNAEKNGDLSEADLLLKEAAVAHLGGLLADVDKIGEAELAPLVPRLQALLTANRFSLKWNGLRLRLAQVGQPKAEPAPAATRPRVDLVH